MICIPVNLDLIFGVVIGAFVTIVAVVEYFTLKADAEVGDTAT